MVCRSRPNWARVSSMYGLTSSRMMRSPVVEEHARKQSVTTGFIPLAPALDRLAGPPCPEETVRPVTVRRANAPRLAARRLAGVASAIGVDHGHARAQPDETQGGPHPERAGADHDHVGRSTGLHPHGRRSSPRQDLSRGGGCGGERKSCAGRGALEEPPSVDRHDVPPACSRSGRVYTRGGRRRSRVESVEETGSAGLKPYPATGRYLSGWRSCDLR